MKRLPTSDAASPRPVRPDRETVADHSQGVQLATIQALARYWTTGYDWRRCEERLNSLPQFMTEIDGLDIHFIHVRSRHHEALPLIVTHGWPGSVIEQLKIIGRLTDPTAHGASEADAFHVVVPSLPGYGFSGKPTTTGWGPARIARAWLALMKRLGYSRFVAQGGDWGGLITEVMATQAPPELLGVHTNFPATVPPEVDEALRSGSPPPSSLSADERRAYEQLRAGESSEATRRRWARGRRHCPGWLTRPLAWQPGYSTMTPSVRSNSARDRRRACFWGHRAGGHR